MPSIISLSIGQPQILKRPEIQMSSGICKDPVSEAVLTKERFMGDDVADHEHHGGLDRAVCFYPYEHYEKWEKEFNIKLPPSALGENLTVTGMLEEEVCIGDIYHIGDAVVQITQGRIPCSTISIRNGVNIFLKRIVETCFTGFLARVLEEGTIRSDSKITLIERHPEQVSVLFANRTILHDQKNLEAIRRILSVKELAAVWREKLEKYEQQLHQDSV